MADLPEQRLNLQVEETRYNAAVSEAFSQRAGKAINFINKRQYQAKTFQVNGVYGGVGVPYQGIDGAWAMFNNSEIVGLCMYNLGFGAIGTTTFDLVRITQSGGAETSIFTTTPKISSAAGNNAYLFYDFLNGVALENPIGVTQPVLTSTSLDAGDLIRCDLVQAQAYPALTCGLILYYRPR